MLSSLNLGKFEYDEHLFRVCRNGILLYIGEEFEGSLIGIPKGILNCSEMFFGNKILMYPPVIPDSVRIARAMFAGSNIRKAPVIPEGLLMCDRMFAGCIWLEEKPKFPKNASVVGALEGTRFE